MFSSLPRIKIYEISKPAFCLQGVGSLGKRVEWSGGMTDDSARAKRKGSNLISIERRDVGKSKSPKARKDS